MINSYYTNQDQKGTLKALHSKFNKYYKINISGSKLINFLIYYAELNIQAVSDSDLKLQINEYLEKRKRKDGLGSIVDEMFSVE